MSNKTHAYNWFFHSNYCFRTFSKCHTLSNKNALLRFLKILFDAIYLHGYSADQIKSRNISACIGHSNHYQRNFCHPNCAAGKEGIQFVYSTARPLKKTISWWTFFSPAKSETGERFSFCCTPSQLLWLMFNDPMNWSGLVNPNKSTRCSWCFSCNAFTRLNYSWCNMFNKFELLNFFIKCNAHFQHCKIVNFLDLFLNYNSAYFN